MPAGECVRAYVHAYVRVGMRKLANPIPHTPTPPTPPPPTLPLLVLVLLLLQASHRWVP